MIRISQTALFAALTLSLTHCSKNGKSGGSDDLSSNSDVTTGTSNKVTQASSNATVSSAKSVLQLEGDVPRGYVDAMQLNGKTLDVSGWSFDPLAPSEANEVHFYLDGFPGAGGTYLTSVKANIDRPDLKTAFSDLPNARHGFTYTYTFSDEDMKRPHTLHVWGISLSGKANINLSGSPLFLNTAKAMKYFDPGLTLARAATVNPTLPFGFWQLDGTRLSGWAIDRDAPYTPRPIHIYRVGADGSHTFVTAIAGDIERTDIQDTLNKDYKVPVGTKVAFAWTAPALAAGESWEVFAIDQQDARQHGKLAGPGDPKTLAMMIAETNAPNSLFYYESCKGAPCWAHKADGSQGVGSAAPNSGFYTLANDEGVHDSDGTYQKQTCKISALSAAAADHPKYDNSPANLNVTCPFAFGWTTGPASQNVASIVVDTRSFNSVITRNNYLGLQLNPAANIYGGMPESRPDVSKILGIEMTVRDGWCEASTEEAHYGRMPYYISWYSPTTGKDYQLSINLLEYEKELTSPSSDTPAISMKLSPTRRTSSSIISRQAISASPIPTKTFHSLTHKGHALTRMARPGATFAFPWRTS